MKLVFKVIMYSTLIGMNLYVLEILYSKNELFGFKGSLIIFGTVVWIDKLCQSISNDRS